MLGQGIGHRRTPELRGESSIRIALSSRAILLAILCLSIDSVELRAQEGLTAAQMEEFLRTAEVLSTERLGAGRTGMPHRVTLSNGQLTHHAHVQTVDIFKRKFKIGGRTIYNYRDSYRYNIAAYELDKLLRLNLVPVSVERPYKGRKAAFTWWVDNVQMSEAARLEAMITPPNADSWTRQMNRVWVFVQLIHDMDTNLENLLIDDDWKIWKVDLTQSFSEQKELLGEGVLLPIDQEFYDALGSLTQESIKPTLGTLLSGPEIEGLLARRDRIIEFFDEAAASEEAQE